MSFKQKNKKMPLIKFREFWEIDDMHVSTSYGKLLGQIEKFTPLIMKPKHSFNWWKSVAISACVALFIIVGLYWHTLVLPVLQPVEIVYITDRNSQFELSDGTKVWLSANSQLQYQQNFTGNTRDVTLDGEAYFEVAHNSKQPFRVLANGQTAVALGTSFNIRAYESEPDVKVALVEGSVSVTAGDTGEEVVLIPSQEASVLKNDGTIAVNDVDLINLMSWKTGRYVFNNMKFEDIVNVLEKGFSVTINIENESLKSKPYNMRFENGESLEKILDLIQINARFFYQYHNGNIIIK